MDYVATTLAVRDVAASLTFYTTVLGFDEWFRWENDGQLSAGGLRRGEGRIILSRAHGLSADDLARRGIGAGLYIVLDGGDIDALYAAVQGRATVLTPIGDRPWGDRTFEIADPDGYRVEVAKTLG